MTINTTQALLTLICTPSLERTITDWLLEQEDLTGFTSIKINGHGSDPNSLSLIEQVQGSRKQVMFQIQITQERAKKVIIDLKQDLKGAKIHYWLLPILEAGNLSTENISHD